MRLEPVLQLREFLVIPAHRVADNYYDVRLVGYLLEQVTASHLLQGTRFL